VTTVTLRAAQLLRDVRLWNYDVATSLGINRLQPLPLPLTTLPPLLLLLLPLGTPKASGERARHNEQRSRGSSR
jgi:hypothetical protein